MLTREHNVYQYTEGINIGSRIALSDAQLFRRGIADRTHYNRIPAAILQTARGVEIDKHHSAVFINDNIFGLDISVDDTPFMQYIQTRTQRGNHFFHTDIAIQSRLQHLRDGKTVDIFLQNDLAVLQNNGIVDERQVLAAYSAQRLVGRNRFGKAVQDDIAIDGLVTELNIILMIIFTRSRSRRSVSLLASNPP